jgi:hypothetical protein
MKLEELALSVLWRFPKQRRLSLSAFMVILRRYGSRTGSVRLVSHSGGYEEFYLLGYNAV